MAKRKQELLKASIEGLVEGAASELRALQEEMQSWYDNMPESLQGGDKASTIESTAETLDEAANTLEGLDWPEEFDGKPLDHLQIEYSPLTKKRPSRSDRNSQASYELGAAADALRELVSVAQEKDADIDVSDIEQLADDIEEARDNADNAEFPGMMG